MPKVSIIMVAYNREKFIAQAIESVLFQSFSDWELVIVNDGSTDNTDKIIKKYTNRNLSIKYSPQVRNKGIAESRKIALSLCEGEYVAVLDSDDIWIDKHKLKKQVDFLDNNKDYVLIGGMAGIVDQAGSVIGKIYFAQNDEQIRNKLLFSNQFVHSSIMYRKKAVLEIGGYKEYKLGEDYDLILRMGTKGKFANLPDVLINYRKHLASATWKNRAFSAKEHLRIIKQYRGNVYPNYCLAIIKAYFRIMFAYLRLI